MERQFDYIIVGQGIAGTLLTWFLQRRGARILVIDKYNPSSSSNVSAGIIHPITGRRKIKTWMADTLIPFADECYSALEQQFGKQFYHKQNILELVDNTKDYNDWLMRSGDNEIKKYFSNETTNDLYKEAMLAFQIISLQHCGWVDVKTLLSAFREKLVADHLLSEESFDPDDLIIREDRVIYKDNSAKKIIFCEGWLATQNPYWSWLPFLPAKGEILTIRCPGLKAKHILIKNFFILPIGDDLYKIGSNYEWKELNEIPTQKIKDELVAKLKQVLALPYEIIKHEAGVRPAVQDRRPFIGLHPNFKNVGIFNGLGTKGVLLAPYFANQFAKFLFNETVLHAEVNIERFKKTD